MDGKSLDIKNERMNDLKALFPEIFTEGKIDWEKAKVHFNENASFHNERYVLNWAGKSDAIKILQTPTTATLVPQESESVNWDNTENIFIEGENLEVLKILQKSYYGKIKMIEIDPPYNTGSDSFVYPDRFAESKEEYLKRIGDMDEEGYLMKEGLFHKNSKDNGHYHSNWLSMMYPRLFLARNLLRDDGLIFIHIDDNEVHNLRMIMNEIYGEENFIASFIWNTEGHTDNQFQVKINHEYILLYAKNGHETELEYIIDPNIRKASNLWKGFAENSITKNGPGNPPSEVVLPKGFPCKVNDMRLEKSVINKSFFETVKKVGYISRDLTKEHSVSYPIRLDDMSCMRGGLAEECRVFSGWANVNKLKLFIQNQCVPITDENGDKITFYLSENGVIYYRKEREKARNILSVLRNMGTTEQMRSELEEMGIIFQYPKPKQLLKYLMQIGLGNDDVVLDFFAGSGTIGQATYELLEERKLRSKFILVQLPEAIEQKNNGKNGCKTIADIAKKRIAVSAQKTQEKEKGNKDLFEEHDDTLVDYGFKIFKLTPSNFKIWRSDLIDSEEDLSKQLNTFVDPTKDGTPEENMLFELILKSGFPLTTGIEEKKTDGKKYYAVADNALYIVLSGVSQKVIDAIIEQKPKKVICLDKLFKGNDQLKTNTVLQMKDAKIDFRTI